MFHERRRYFSHPSSRSGSPSLKSNSADTKGEVPCRFSYVRASNTYHKYGQRPSSKTSEDTSAYSSKEDLLECNKAVHLRRKRLGDKINPLKRFPLNKQGCSSSDDLLNEESDATDGFLSSGLPETDGSVFSSQEDLLEPKTKCSANVKKFIRRHNSGKGSSSSRISSSGTSHQSYPLEIRVTEPIQDYIRNGSPYGERECVTPFFTGSEDELTYKHRANSPFRLPRSSSSSSGQFRVTFSPKSYRSRYRDQSSSEYNEPLRLKVQSVIAKTVSRLVEHLGSINKQVGIIDEKCGQLQKSMCALEYDQHLLNSRFSDLETRIEKLSAYEATLTDSDSGCPQLEHSSYNGKCTEDGKSYSSQVSKYQQLEYDTKTQRAHSLHFSSFSQVSGYSEVLLSQLKKVKISSKSSGSRVWGVLITLLVAGIVWDVKSAGSFYGSRIGWALERAGLVPYLEVLGKSIKSSTIQAYRWCIYNIPFYYSKGCDLAEPYLLLVWSRFEGVAAYAWTGVQSAVDYIPVIKENIETSLPGLSSLVSHYGMAALAGAQSMAVAVKEVSMPYLLQVHDFISTRVLVGALAPEKLYEYILHSVDYVSQLLMKLHSTLLDDFDTHTDEASINSSL